MKHERLDINQTEYDFLRARICHAMWCAFQMGAGQRWESEPSSSQIRSQMDGLKEWDRDPSMTPQQNHENWMRFKLAEGWQYGPERNEARRENPCLVDWDDLPSIEREKDSMDLFARAFATEIIEDAIGSTGVKQWTA